MIELGLWNAAAADGLHTSRSADALDHVGKLAQNSITSKRTGPEIPTRLNNGFNVA